MMNNRVELIDTELELVNGGNWIDDAWDSTKNFVSKYKREVIIAAGVAAGAALCATGIGAAAGVGLLHATASTVIMAGMAGAEVGAVAGACAADSIVKPEQNKKQ